MKTQSSVEYLSVFTAALILVVIVVAVVGMFILNNHQTTNTPASCYISPQINCQQLVVANNGVQSKAIVIFTNNLGQTIHFSSNAIQVLPGYSQAAYSGQCFPYNAVPGAEVVCNATLGSFNPSLGTQLNPRFQLTYAQCASNACASIGTPYNAVGTGTTYVSTATTYLYSVELETNPAIAGAMITLNGVPYPTGTYIQFIKTASYTITADPPAGYNFAGWAGQGRVTITNPSNPSTTSFATGNGVIIATFAQTPAAVTPVVTLSLQNGFNNQGTTDLANAITTVATDQVQTVYCTTSSITGPCNSAGTVLVTGTGSASQNVGTLPAGTYSIQACDITYTPAVCSANVILDQVESYTLQIIASVTGGSDAYITGTGTAYYPQGSSETISTAVSGLPSNTYYAWNQYTGSCSGSVTSSCPSSSYYSGPSQAGTLTMYGNIIETAYYTASYGLTVASNCNTNGYSGALISPCPTASGFLTAGGNGQGPNGSYYPGNDVTVTASSSTAYWTFQGWTTVGGGYSGASTSGSFTMPANPVMDIANYKLVTEPVTIQLAPAAASSSWQLMAGQSGADGSTDNGVSSNTFTEPYGTTLNYICTNHNYGNAYAWTSFSGGYAGSSSDCVSNAGVIISGPTTITASYTPCYQLSILPQPGYPVTFSAPVPQSTDGCSYISVYSYESGAMVPVTFNPGSLGTGNGYTNPVAGTSLVSSSSTIYPIGTASPSGGDAWYQNNEGPTSYTFSMTQPITEYVKYAVEAPTVTATISTGGGGTYSYTSQCASGAYQPAYPTSTSIAYYGDGTAYGVSGQDKAAIQSNPCVPGELSNACVLSTTSPSAPYVDYITCAITGGPDGGNAYTTLQVNVNVPTCTATPGATPQCSTSPTSGSTDSWGQA